MDELTELARRANHGDEHALEELVRRTQGEVWRLCAHLGSRTDADDLTQDTYLRVVKALPGFRGEASFRTWLLSIARRTCADHVRSATRRRALVTRLGTRHEEPASNPTDAVAVEDAVAHLDPDRQEAFVLTQVLGLPYAEAAAVVGCPVGTIRSRVARARDDLVAALGPPPSGDAAATGDGTVG